MAGRALRRRVGWCPERAFAQSCSGEAEGELKGKMPHFVYILECADGSFYVGSTVDVPARLAQHNAGRGGQYTGLRLPVRLAYSEECSTREASVQRERQIKRWTAAKKSALIEGRLRDLTALARRRR
jgi:putative endonuclease